MSHNSKQTPQPRSIAAERELIAQIQSELVSLMRVAPDEKRDWQQPLSFGNLSSTVEGEIYRGLW